MRCPRTNLINRPDNGDANARKHFFDREKNTDIDRLAFRANVTTNTNANVCTHLEYYRGKFFSSLWYLNTTRILKREKIKTNILFKRLIFII